MAAQNQHSVAQFHLRKFAISENPEQIWVFDKQKKNSFVTSVRNICSERGFYDIEVESGRLSLEPSLSDLETKAGIIMSKLIDRRNLRGLAKEDRILLSMFVSAQFLRSKAFRENMKDFSDHLRAKSLRMGFSEEAVDKELGNSDESAKISTIQSLALHTEEYTKLIFHKTWLLLETSPDEEFYIGDNPVVLHNSRSFGPFGNLGLALQGIEIYLPLARDLVLAMWCPSVIEKIQKTKIESIRLLRKMKQYSNEELIQKVREMQSGISKINDLVYMQRKGMPTPSCSENVTFLNSLQVMFAERFVMASKPQFELVEKMLGDNEKYSHSLRFTL